MGILIRFFFISLVTWSGLKSDTFSPESWVCVVKDGLTFLFKPIVAPVLENSDMQNVTHGLHAAPYLCNMVGDLISETQNIWQVIVLSTLLYNIIQKYVVLLTIQHTFHTKM